VPSSTHSSNATLSSNSAPQWLRVPATTDARLAVSACATCGTAASVEPVRLTEGVDAGVQYWTCKTCGLVWGTRDTPTPADPNCCTCPACQRPGRVRPINPDWDHHYLCAACGASWKVPAVLAVEA
jgi:transposase-like protein